MIRVTLIENDKLVFIFEKILQSFFMYIFRSEMGVQYEIVVSHVRD